MYEEYLITDPAASCKGVLTGKRPRNLRAEEVVACQGSVPIVVTGETCRLTLEGGTRQGGT